MVNFNKVVLAGHLTRDWETRTSKAGTQVGKTGIAVNRRSRESEETMFVDLIAFGQTSETLSKHTGKGRPLLVEGRLSLSQWESNDGTKRSKHEVIVENFQFVRSEDGYRESVQAARENEQAAVDDENIPF